MGMVRAQVEAVEEHVQKRMKHFTVPKKRRSPVKVKEETKLKKADISYTQTTEEAYTRSVVKKMHEYDHLKNKQKKI